MAILALGAVFATGASCGNSGPRTEGSGTHTSEEGASSDDAPIERLEAVDVSSLTGGERGRWVSLVNELTSPCGEPISIARCVEERRACQRCVPAARYLVRLIAFGYEPSEIQELFRARYSGQPVRLETDGAPVRGAPMAPVTVVAFSDFECPHCAAAHPIVLRMLSELEGRVRFVFMNYPLDGHTHAVYAARAAIAAGKQGKFWEMHDHLFEHQDRLEQEDLERYAEELGLDMTRFRADMASSETQRKVESDKQQGRRFGVRGTPTIFVNGRMLKEPVQDLPAYVREELDR